MFWPHGTQESKLVLNLQFRPQTPKFKMNSLQRWEATFLLVITHICNLVTWQSLSHWFTISSINFMTFLLVIASPTWRWCLNIMKVASNCLAALLVAPSNKSGIQSGYGSGAGFGFLGVGQKGCNHVKETRGINHLNGINRCYTYINIYYSIYIYICAHGFVKRSLIHWFAWIP